MDYKKKPRVLVVDDNLINVQLLTKILHDDGLESAVANNGMEALDYFKSDTADLILLDIMMPDISGYEVCDKLKLDPKTKDIPVIFLTAKSGKESVIQGFSRGGVDYLTKPFNKSELNMRVKTHIDLKLSKDRIIESRKELSESNATKNKFFSIIAHDLKNPLSGLLNISEALLNIDNSETQQIDELHKMLHRVVMSQFKLLENLLEWSSLQTQNRTVNFENCSLEEIIEDIEDLFETLARNKKIKINFIKPDKEQYAYGDERMIETILRNIVSNAIKFTGENGTVEISIYDSDIGVGVKVSDTGIGIKKERIENLFNYFETISTSGTYGEAGTGLGLSLAKELIDMINGQIFVESVVDKGSMFKIEFLKPVKQ
jgi:two-component system sensor histidine kinase/response regulator